MRSLRLSILPLLLFAGVQLRAQVNNEIVQVVAPPGPQTGLPPANATVEELESQGDELRSQKSYFDALDYYQAALAKDPKNARIYNKAGIAELQMYRFKQSRRRFERAIKLDRQFADAYNNLGVVYYKEKKFGEAIRQYQQAIQLQSDIASYYSNLGAVFYSQKDWDKAAASYGRAVQLDPDIFTRTSRSGVAAQLTTPEERAHFDYLLAKLFAKQNDRERSLEYLRRAMEEGYKEIGDVYKDPAFQNLRTDDRFTQLMAAKPQSIPE
jgi:tetratricopeptide (TPR) repeat protein